MKVRVKTKRDRLPNLEKAAKALKGRRVGVCVPGPEGELAQIHEFGCRIPVTPKMRAFLHYNGVHLRPGTAELVIPERSFLRAGYDAYSRQALRECRGRLADLAAGRCTAEEYLDTVGRRLAELVRGYARNLQAPPNAPLTVSGAAGAGGKSLRGKKSSSPLMDTGSMIAAITYKVE